MHDLSSNSLAASGMMPPANSQVGGCMIPSGEVFLSCCFVSSPSPLQGLEIIVMHPERNWPKVWYPYILRSCGVHYRNISGQLNSRIHLGFTSLTTMVLFCCPAAGCRFGVLQQRGTISKLVQNSTVIQLLLLASSSSSSRSKSEREIHETSQKCFRGKVLLVF